MAIKICSSVPVLLSCLRSLSSLRAEKLFAGQSFKKVCHEVSQLFGAKKADHAIARKTNFLLWRFSEDSCHDFFHLRCFELVPFSWLCIKIYFANFFCTGLPLARVLDGFDQHYYASAVHCCYQQRHWLTLATSRKFLENTRIQTQGRWVWSENRAIGFFYFANYELLEWLWSVVCNQNGVVFKNCMYFYYLHLIFSS